MNPYAKQYQKNQVETATPEQILLMLYDGAIKYLNLAKATMEGEKNSKSVEIIHNNIVSAQKIITEFMSTLDMEIGGEVAKNLYDLYSYLYRRLVRANIKKDVEMVDEVLKHLKGLRETWAQAIDIAKKEGTLSQLGKNPAFNNQYANQSNDEDEYDDDEYEDDEDDEYDEYEDDEE